MSWRHARSRNAVASALTAALLEVRQASKRFGPVQALDRVDFALRAGEVHALLGENGAGKSTLIKGMTGALPYDSGDLKLEGQLLALRSPLDAQRVGISTVYQELNLAPNLSVAENIALGRAPLRWGRIDWKLMECEALAVLDRLDVRLDPRATLRSFPAAIRQLVAIARALAIKAKVLVLDEPTSSLDADEVERLFGVLRRLKSHGLGIIFVSHLLDQVYAIADRMTVLRNGRLVGEYVPAELPRLGLIARMLGREEEEVARLSRPPAVRRATAEEKPPRLEVEELGRRRMLRPVSLAARRGEVVGLAGLLGSGRTELARLIFGLARADTGTIRLDGVKVRLLSARRSLRAGVALMPEDRKVEGIFPDLSIRENLCVALQARRGWLRPLSRRAQAELAERTLRTLRVAAPGLETPVGRLSGGNQQKVLLARWLACEPRVLVLDEPTRGVDVGARAEIEAFAERLCADGLALIWIAADLEELARTSHRVVVLRDRAKVGELAGDELEIGAMLRVIAGEHDAA